MKRLYFGHANSPPTSDIDSHPRLEIMEVIIPEGTTTEDLLKKTPAANSTHHSWVEDELALMILEASIPAIADETGYWGLNLQKHEIVFIGNIGKSAPPNIQDHPDFAVFMSFADLKRFKNHFIPDKGICYLLRISPGCGCCPHEAEVQGPWFSREKAEERMEEVKRSNSKSMRIAEREYELIRRKDGRNWIALDDYLVRHTFLDLIEDPDDIGCCNYELEQFATLYPSV